MKQTKKLSRKVISYVLALVMVLSTMTGIVPGMSITAQAAEKSVTFTNNGTQDGITVNGKYQRSRTGNHFFISSGVILTISSGNDNIITKLEITDSKVYSGRFTESHITVSTGNKSIQDSVLTVTDVNAKSVTLSATDSLYWTTNKIVVYYNTNTKSAQNVTAPTAATDLTYKKDEAQALLTKGASVTTGNTATGSVQYKVGADGTWSTEIPKKTNAGTYNVYYKVEGNDTYAEYAPTDPISVTIAKADPETPTGITAKYNDNTGEINLPDGWKWQNDWYFFETVGTATCKADFAGNDNYNAKTGVDITVEVGKADAAISYEKTEVSAEYGAEFSQNQITNPGDADPTFTSSKESVATVSNTGYVTIKGIGETTITATIKDNEHYHYTTTEASYKLTVNPISTVIRTAPTADEITYGQKLSKSTLTGGEAVSHGRSVAGTFAWKEPDLVPNASESGEYEVVFTPTDSTNYAESTCNVKVKVNKAAAPATKESLSPEQKPAAKNADELVYTGEPIELVTAPTNPLEGYKVQYSKDNGTTWTDTIPTETNVGTYTVKVKYVSDNYENIDLDDITVEITTVEKAAFNAEKEVQKKAADNLAADGDSDASKKLIEDAKKAIDELAYDETKSLDENKAALAAIVSKLKDELTAKRAEEKKEADDTAAADAVAEKINALPASDKIATTDKEAIEAARKAYDALTADQKAKVSAETLKKLEEAEKALAAAEKKAADDAKKSEGKNEWIDGQWYGADGNTEYKAKGSWKQNDKGWWYEDTDGWYPKSQWQKIDGLWYYFGVSGYMAASEWIDGWWCDADGACRYEYQASWKQDSTGWWYGDASGWYAVSSWQKIDNIWYYFGADGYMVTNQYVDGYWVNADGAWAE